MNIPASCTSCDQNRPRYLALLEWTSEVQYLCTICTLVERRIRDAQIIAIKLDDLETIIAMTKRLTMEETHE